MHSTAFKNPPFRIEEKGWGEFDLTIILHMADRGGEQTLLHDLNFHKSKYEVLHTLNFPTNRPGLLKLLEKSGTVVPTAGGGATSADHGSDKRKLDTSEAANSSTGNGTSNGAGGSGGGDGPSKPKKAKPSSASPATPLSKGGVDLERLADMLHQLPEEDLVGVVQMVTDNRTSDMYVKNDVAEGEFHIDLCTLPDSLLRSLLNYVRQRAATAAADTAGNTGAGAADGVVV